MITKLVALASEDYNHKAESLDWNKNIGVKPGLKWISKKLLIVDRGAYQRDKQKTAMDIVANFRWDKFGAIVVSKRGDKYAVVEGQQRSIAAEMRGDIQEVPCVVFSDMTVKAEAESFVGQATGRKSLTALERFKAWITAERPDAVATLATCREGGYNISSNKRKDGYTIECALLLIQIQKTKALADILRAITDFWGVYPDRSNQRVIAATYDLHRKLLRLGLNINEEHIAAKLRKTNLLKLLAAAKRTSVLASCTLRAALYNTMANEVKSIAMRYKKTTKENEAIEESW